MRGSYEKSLLIVLVALLMVVAAGVLIIMSSPKEAKAQTSTIPRGFDPVTAEDMAYFEKLIESTNSADPAKQAAAKNVVKRQSVRYIPRLAPRLAGKGGLVGTAAATWGIVGLELYYLPCWECGPLPAPISAEVTPSTGSLYGGTWDGNCSNNGVPGMGNGACGVMTGFISYAKYTRQGSTNIVDAYATRSSRSWRHYLDSTGIEHFEANTPYPFIGTCTGVNNTAPWSPTFTDLRFTGGIGSYPSSSHVHLTGTSASAPSSTACSVRMYRSYPSPSPGSFTFGPTAPGNNRMPLLDWRSVHPGNGSTTSGQRVAATPSESTDFINGVVQDPDAPTALPNETQPYQPHDPNWNSTTNPYSPGFDRFSDPDGDLDGDGTPNKTDTDPEGDGDPDIDLDTNEHPEVVPWPATNDPEVDGDPDHDGSANETTPPPEYDPYDPAANPNGDPDGDGVPNLRDVDPDDAAYGAHPWPDPDEPDPFTEWQPPNPDEGDGSDFFGPMIDDPQYDEDGHEHVNFDDGTHRTRYTDESGNDITVWRNYYGPIDGQDKRAIARMDMDGGGTIFHHNWDDDLEDLLPSFAGCSINEDEIKRIVKSTFPDGLKRYRIFAKGTTPEETDTATPLCDEWTNSNGNAVSAPSDLSNYPLVPWTT